MEIVMIDAVLTGTAGVLELVQTIGILDHPEGFWCGVAEWWTGKAQCRWS